MAKAPEDYNWHQHKDDDFDFPDPDDDSLYDDKTFNQEEYEDD